MPSTLPGRKTLAASRVALVSRTAVVLMACAASTAALAQDTPTLLMLRPGVAKSNEITILPPLKQEDLTQIKVGGKPAPITSVNKLLKGPNTLQLAILLDSSIQIGILNQFGEILDFAKALPPNVEIGIGYMKNGRVTMQQTFTPDRSLLKAALHEQPDAAKIDNGSPYFCLNDLTKHWPSPDPAKLRAVLMITDGVDRLNSNQGSDALNPNVTAAATNATRASVSVSSIYYMDPEPVPGRSAGGLLEGQTNLDQLSNGANGRAFFRGQSAPVTFAPFLKLYAAMLGNESVVTVAAKGNGYKPVDIKSDNKDIKIYGPDSVMIGNVMGK